jgi:tuberous sclerosis protein 2
LNITSANRAVYEDDLIERIVIPHLQHIDSDPDIIVRNAAAQLLVDLCVECENKRCLELMAILEKVC